MYDWFVRPDAIGLDAMDILVTRLNPFCPNDGTHRRQLQADAVQFDRNGHGATYRDHIAPSVQLGRGNHGCLTVRGNAVGANAVGSNGNPTGTRWAPGNFAEVGRDVGDTESPYGSFCSQTSGRRNRIGSDPQLSRCSGSQHFFPLVFSPRYCCASDGFCMFWRKTCTSTSFFIHGGMTDMEGVSIAARNCRCFSSPTLTTIIC
eukprot:SAG31_NODE_2888_length_4948_cov_2.055475_2_plen_204_part_00